MSTVKFFALNKFHNDGETSCVITIFDLGGNWHSPLKSLINIQTSDEKHVNTTSFLRSLHPFLLSSSEMTVAHWTMLH
jgi:hypothetical protein